MQSQSDQSRKVIVGGDRLGLLDPPHTCPREEVAAGVDAKHEEPERSTDLERLTNAAATTAARSLLKRGFDQATAVGSDLMLRHGSEIWIVTNVIEYQPGVREQLLDRFAAAVVNEIANSLPTES